MDSNFRSDFIKSRGKNEIGDSEKLRVLTLNCWGIPYLSKVKKERFDAIGQELKKGNYDIVSLQEVWDKKDYETLRAVLEKIFPYSYYFFGGVYGTGICIFSRYPILKTFAYPFAVSGYPYAIAHGDWFGGKGACFALIDHPKMKIHFFTSHLHAEYDRNNDVYLSHRVVQAYHLSKLIGQITDPEDFVLLCMNTEPEDPCYRILKELPQLSDCWLEGGSKSNCYGNTSDRSENMFTSEKYDKHKVGGPEDGKRIDYIFYRSLDQRWECDSANVTMSKVPGAEFPFSDHDGVEASFVFNQKTSETPDFPSDSETVISVLSEATTLIKTELKHINKHFYKKCIAIILLIAFILLPVFLPAKEGSWFLASEPLGRIVYIYA
ncbi:LOW QUALITY PROTEIN: sphingomyelin phosphodiesterase 2-like [Dendronephthya gigantea]|uniref:LOW QUALITY PROTEIN: sphingomyelin phosphodiesterase 2-like n=1 Tax=Dendronephthya gigantea TaxID=151771 RepID=UPI00106B6599|nr:LOW QUALITY PROTEIN: sphingomyelin phosphodiesterase 2-like [Dendronephthya gigantea]